MCLSANQPGGPRRCDRLGKVNQAIADYKNGKAISDSWLSRIHNLSPRSLTDAGLHATEEQRLEAQQKYRESREYLDYCRNRIAQEIRLHNESEEMKQRMAGEVVIEDPALLAQAGEIMDDSLPFSTFSVANMPTVAEMMKNHRKAHPYHPALVRRRMAPAMIDGKPHPIFRIPVIDVQFPVDDDSALEYADFDKVALDDKNEWVVDTGTFVGVVQDIMDKDDGLVTKQQARNKEDATAMKAWRALYAGTIAPNANQYAEESREINFHSFLTMYPGDNSYSSKVRAQAKEHKDYVRVTDFPLFAPTVQKFREQLHQYQPDPTTAKGKERLDNTVRTIANRPGPAGTPIVGEYDPGLPKGARVTSVVGTYYDSNTEGSKYPGGAIYRIQGEEGKWYVIDRPRPFPYGFRDRAQVRIEDGISDGYALDYFNYGRNRATVISNAIVSTIPGA